MGVASQDAFGSRALRLADAAAKRFVSLPPIDAILLVYTAYVGALVLVRFPHVVNAGRLLLLHVLIGAFILLLPPRGSPWERSPAGEPIGLRAMRELVRFVRYGYPLALVIVFFEEVERTVHAVYYQSAYWFESFLYDADRWLFGELPAVILAPLQTPWLDETMHFFYASYYFMIIGGAGAAYFGGGKARSFPAPGFDRAIASATLGFLFAFVWYPWLPSRGPWENVELMAALPAFEGGRFQQLVEAIIAGGAVSGGCFPSGHVAGTWGMVLGLAPRYRWTTAAFAVLATGMSIACVYTRYHHAADIFAGLAAAGAGAWTARKLYP